MKISIKSYFFILFFIYFLSSPYLSCLLLPCDYKTHYDIVFLALGVFFIAQLLSSSIPNTSPSFPRRLCLYVPKSGSAFFLTIFFSVAISVQLITGLWDKRIGTELAANRSVDLGYIYLFVRSAELISIALIILLLISFRLSSLLKQRIAFSSKVLFFSSVSYYFLSFCLSSRMAILMFAIWSSSILLSGKKITLNLIFKRNTKSLICLSAASLSLLALFLISLFRYLKSSSGFAIFFFNEFIFRLNGLELYSRIRALDSQFVSLWSPVFNQYNALVSLYNLIVLTFAPQSQLSRDLKASMLTSTKSFILDYLSIEYNDYPNGFLTEPYFLAGLFGVLAACVFMFFIADLGDRILFSLTHNGLSRFTLASLSAIISSIFYLEYDFLGIVRTLLVSWIISRFCLFLFFETRFPIVDIDLPVEPTSSD